MAIYRYMGQPIKEGDVVCRRSLFTNGICGRPVTVVRVSGSRAWVVEEPTDIARRIDASTIEFIVDTREEGLMIASASQEFLERERVIEQEHQRLRAERKAYVVASLVNSP
jgi:hypothetical protein